MEKAPAAAGAVVAADAQGDIIMEVGQPPVSSVLGTLKDTSLEV